MKTIGILLLLLALANFNLVADDLVTMGVARLRTNNASLTGLGVTVGQAEAQNDLNENDWEVYPPNADSFTGIFSWINTNGTATTFPNSLGTESSHADQVGSRFYGTNGGVAPGVQAMDNYEADYFFALVVTEGLSSDPIVNQSFIFTGESSQTTVDSPYDDDAALNGTLFCSAVGNGGPPNPPGTAYNSVGVGAYGIGANSSVGPTSDNGRSKPDLVAPGNETSFTTPYVAGAAAVLLQAAASGAGGANTSAAGDMRTLKALLLNGAIKPGDWTHTPTAPLDTRYGAGVLNLYFSAQQLLAGQQTVSSSAQVPSGPSHLPGAPTAVISSLLGWDYETETSSVLDDAVNHYYFNNSASPSASLTLTATLAWNRQTGQTGINNLSLFLYNSASGGLITNSVSTVDNIQHIYVPSLPRGQYDLQVVKSGGPSEVSALETYALAFQFYPIASPQLAISSAAGTTVVSWPWSPTIFNLQQTTSLSPPITWSALSAVGLITNTSVSVTLNPGTTEAFYRLLR